ncbi:MAG: general secretion pathway protein GspK [Phycisphaerae bacterium]|nr:general secretion pathway protein GspK [Phycisphaerae bacterium]
MILLITLVILVIMSTLGYTLSVRVAARRHRDQYVIDCGIARHACVSGMKYALVSVGELEFELISRPNEPDFSDLFALSEVEYQKLLVQMSEYLASQRLTDANAARSDDVNDEEEGKTSYSSIAANVEIPGPYGPPWPLVTEPIKLEIGSAKVVIAVEDENAKYPLGWTLLTDEKLQDRAGAGWTGLCEWMGYSNKEIEDLTEDLKAIGKTKPFKMEFKTETVDTVAKAGAPTATVTRPGVRTSRTTPAGSAAARRTVGKKTITAQEQLRTQNSEFSRLFHSSMLNAALLSRPSIESDSRQESAMKYLGLWGTRHVNVNTAPRHVLEAAMAFGSIANAPRIAEAIIQQRKIKPVTDVNEIKQASLAFSDSIEDCRDFLVTSSTVFTIRVTAVSGAARATALAAVTKEGNKVQQIAVVCD